MSTKYYNLKGKWCKGEYIDIWIIHCKTWNINIVYSTHPGSIWGATYPLLCSILQLHVSYRLNMGRQLTDNFTLYTQFTPSALHNKTSLT